MVPGRHSVRMGPDSAGSTAKVRKGATSDSQTHSCQHSDRKGASTRPETFCHRRAPVRPRQCHVSCSPERHQFGGSSERHGWSPVSQNRCFEGGTSESQGSRTLTEQLAQAMQRQNQLRQEMLAQVSEPPVVGSGPESCLEVVALRARVAELEACARRPPRNSEDAAQNIRAEAAKRRLGTCSEDVVPSTDQQLSEWLDGMNCDLRDALDVGDMESATTLSGLISRGAAKKASLVPPSTVTSMVP